MLLLTWGNILDDETEIEKNGEDELEVMMGSWFVLLGMF
jgi:hypothetical protein